MLQLKLQYFGHLMWRANSLENTVMLGKTEETRRGEQQVAMVGWNHQFNRHAMGSLAYCSAWSCKELDTTEQLNNNNYIHLITTESQAQVLIWSQNTLIWSHIYTYMISEYTYWIKNILFNDNSGQTETILNSKLSTSAWSFTVLSNILLSSQKYKEEINDCLQI